MTGPDETPPSQGTGPGADRSLAPGTAVGDYVVKRRLGRGGHGTVYEAEHAILGRRVALKLMHSQLAESRDLVARFLREARLVNQIRHPCIVDIQHFGELPGGRPYCVMELLPGQNLWSRLGSAGRLELRVAVAILEQLCAALGAAHAAGVVHRDIKASNVMLDDGDPPAVKLLDFGIAKVNAPGAEGLTRVGERLGTRSYMSPEQLREQPVDARTDVYALGVLLFQMLTGRLPFVASDPAELEQMHLEAPPPRPSLLAPIPATFDTVVARCMAKRPEDRYPSAEALAADARWYAGLARPETARDAIAIHATFATEAADEDALARQAATIEVVEEAVQSEAFDVPLATASSLLAVRVLPTAAASAREALSRARELVRRLPDIAREASSEAAEDLVVWLHVGDARVEGDEVVGGEICRPEGWAGRAEPGIHQTPASFRRA